MADSGVYLDAGKTRICGLFETKILVGFWAEEDIQRQLIGSNNFFHNSEPEHKENSQKQFRHLWFLLLLHELATFPGWYCIPSELPAQILKTLSVWTHVFKNKLGENLFSSKK